MVTVLQFLVGFVTLASFALLIVLAAVAATWSLVLMMQELLGMWLDRGKEYGKGQRAEETQEAGSEADRSESI